MVKRLNAVIMLMTIVAASSAHAGSGYDACRQEESRLRSEESDRCTGWGYILNPSACFNTRKALAPYYNGKCRAIAADEGVVETRTESAKPAAATPSPQPAREDVAAPQQPVQPQERTKGVVEEKHLSELEQLRREVAELRNDVERLKDELQRLKVGR